MSLKLQTKTEHTHSHKSCGRTTSTSTSTTNFLAKIFTEQLSRKKSLRHNDGVMKFPCPCVQLKTRAQGDGRRRRRYHDNDDNVVITMTTTSPSTSKRLTVRGYEVEDLSVEATLGGVFCDNFVKHHVV